MIRVVGAGPGSVRFLTREAEDIIRNSENIVAFGRIGDSMKNLNGYIRTVSSLKELDDEILQAGGDITVLATGDPQYYGVMNHMRKLSEKWNLDTQVIPGITSMQYLASRTGVTWENALHVSMHGREGVCLKEILQKQESIVFILADRVNTPGRILRTIKETGVEGRFITGYRLSHDDERILETDDPEELDLNDGISLCLFIKDEKYGIERIEKIEKIEKIESEDDSSSVRTSDTSSFKDTDFIREKVPMTKYEVRLLTMEYMEVKCGGIYLEIGSGTGSVTSELLRRGAHVTAVESSPEAQELTLRNVEHLLDRDGLTRLKLLRGKAPAVLPPDEYHFDGVFVGGSLGEIEGICRYSYSSMKEDAVIVGNFVTLDNAYTFKRSLKTEGFQDVSLTLLQISEEDHLGILRGRNPVFMVKGRKVTGNKDREQIEESDEKMDRRGHR